MPAPSQKTKLRIWLEIAGAVAAILTGFAGASIWLFQTVSDRAIQRAMLPMKVERLENSTTDHEKKLGDLDKRVSAGELDRANIKKEVAEKGNQHAQQLRELFELVNKRLDRLDDRTERIGERVGVSPVSRAPP